MLRSADRTASGTWVGREEIVTGERLQALAECSLIPRDSLAFHRGVERFARDRIVLDDYAPIDDRALVHVSSKRVLFVYTHALDGFVEHVWPRLTGEGYVLITHNSDGEIDESRVAWIDGQGAKLQRWFAQNAVASHPKLTPLPIGIANRQWEHGNLRMLERAARRAVEPKPEPVFVHFNPGTHPDRQGVWEAVRTAFPGLPAPPFETRRFPAYLEDLARHRFCVCPRGNGIDTHRFWECLYLGVIPIARRSPHVEHWRSQGLPVLVIDAWSDVTPERLEAESRAQETGPRTVAPLLLSSYARLVRDAAQGAGSAPAHRQPPARTPRPE